MRASIAWALAFMVALGCGARPCWADKQEYLEAFGYFTLGQNETQLLVWNDWFEGLPRNQIEIQHAFTDRLTGALYFVEQDLGQGPNYNSTQVEVRYKLARYKKFFVDPALYVNYQEGGGNNPNHVETALVLSKDIGDFNITGNANFEKDLTGPNSDLNPEFHYVVGFSYPLSKPTTYGLEYLVLPQEHQSFLIPGVYLALGHRTWLNLGLQFDLQPSRNPVNLRSIFSIGL